MNDHPEAISANCDEADIVESDRVDSPDEGAMTVPLPVGPLTPYVTGTTRQSHFNEWDSGDSLLPYMDDTIFPVIVDDFTPITVSKDDFVRAYQEASTPEELAWTIKLLRPPPKTVALNPQTGMIPGRTVHPSVAKDIRNLNLKARKVVKRCLELDNNDGFGHRQEDLCPIDLNPVERSRFRGGHSNMTFEALKARGLIEKAATKDGHPNGYRPTDLARRLRSYFESM